MGSRLAAMVFPGLGVARPGRAGHGKAVPPGRRRLAGPAHGGKPRQLVKIHLRIRRRFQRSLLRGKKRAPDPLRLRQQIRQLRQIRHSDDLHPFYGRSLRRIFRWKKDAANAGFPGGVDARQDAGHRPDAPVQPQLADVRPVPFFLFGLFGQAAQNRRGDRQIKAGPLLAHAGRGQVDGNPPGRQTESGVFHRRPHPLLRLLYLSGQISDQDKRGKALAHVRLHRYREALHTPDAKTVDFKKHRILLSSIKKQP